MKIYLYNMMILVYIINICKLIAFGNIIENENKDDFTGLSLYASAACLIDADNGRVLYEKDGYSKHAMASTTKIMTLIIALEYGNPEDTVTVSKYAAAQPEVSLGMSSGEQFILDDLLFSLMLTSHNDTAVAIAEHIGGSVEGFAELMNAKAKSIGALNTHFVTPNGLDADGHYTTAVDIARIAAYAIKNDRFVEITNTPSHSFSNVSGTRYYSVQNKNAFLSMMDGACGVKTGFTGKAGYCFVGAVKTEAGTFISAVLASGWPPHKTYKWSDTIEIMEYGKKYYQRKEISAAGNEKCIIPEIEVRNGIQNKTVPVADEKSLSLLMREDEEVYYEVMLPAYVEAPVIAGTKAGYAVVYIENSVIGKFDLYFSEDIYECNYAFYIKKVLRFCKNIFYLSKMINSHFK